MIFIFKKIFILCMYFNYSFATNTTEITTAIIPIIVNKSICSPKIMALAIIPTIGSKVPSIDDFEGPIFLIATCSKTNARTVEINAIPK